MATTGGRAARAKAIERAARGKFAKEINEFTTANAHWAAAAAAALAGATAQESQEAKVGEADAAQDRAIDALAEALRRDGFPRMNPFRPMGFVDPEHMKRIGFASEAHEALLLVEATRAHAQAGDASREAAKALERAARRVRSSVVALTRVGKARRDADATRDGLALQWEVAYARLRALLTPAARSAPVAHPAARSAPVDGTKRTRR